MIAMIQSSLSQNTLHMDLFRVQTKYKQLTGNWIYQDHNYKSLYEKITSNGNPTVIEWISNRGRLLRRIRSESALLIAGHEHKSFQAGQKLIYFTQTNCKLTLNTE